MSAEVDAIRTVDVPTRLVHGPEAVGRVASLADELGMARPLIVTDQGVVAAGVAAPVLDALSRAVLFADVRANPHVELIDRAARV